MSTQIETDVERLRERIDEFEGDLKREKRLKQLAEDELLAEENEATSEAMRADKAEGRAADLAKTCRMALPFVTDELVAFDIRAAMEAAGEVV